MNFILKYRFFLLLFVILFSIFVFRYSAIYYSLPDGSVFGHTRSYFNDEDAVVADTAKIISAIQKGGVNVLNPGRLIYPMFGRFVSFLPMSVFYLFNYKNIDIGQIFLSTPQQQSIFYSLITYSGRIVSFLSSFISIFLFCALCYLFGVNKKIIFFLSTVYAFMPVDVVLSVQSKSNTLLNLLFLLILYASVCWLKGQSDKWLFFAAFVVGVATGTQLNGILSIIIIATSLLLKYGFDFFNFFEKRVNLLILAMPIFGFFIASPALLINPTMIVAMLKNAGSGSLIYSITGINWTEIGITLFLLSGGWLGLLFLTITFIFGLAYLCWGKLSEIKLVVLWFLFYSIFFLETSLPVARYGLPLLSLWLLLFAILLEKFFLKLTGYIWARIAVYLILLLWFFIVFSFGSAYVRLLSVRPSQILANEFVEEFVPPSSTIGVYYSNKHYKRVPINYTKFQLYACRDMEDGLRPPADYSQPPDWIVVEDNYCFSCLDKLYNIDANYHIVKNWYQDLRFGMLTFDIKGHWLYLQPRIKIFKRN